MLSWRLAAGELFKDAFDFQDNGTVKAQNKSPVNSADNEFSPRARYDSCNSQQTAIMPVRRLIGTIVFLFVVLSLLCILRRHCTVSIKFVPINLLARLGESCRGLMRKPKTNRKRKNGDLGYFIMAGGDCHYPFTS